MNKEKRSNTRPLRAPDRRFSTCTHSEIKTELQDCQWTDCTYHDNRMHQTGQQDTTPELPFLVNSDWQAIHASARSSDDKFCAPTLKPQFDTLNINFTRKSIKQTMRHQFFNRSFSPNASSDLHPVVQKNLGKTPSRAKFSHLCHVSRNRPTHF